MGAFSGLRHGGAGIRFKNRIFRPRQSLRCRLVARCWDRSSRRIPLHEAEEKTLGINHSECGKIIATSWHLPTDLVEAIACHHSPAKAIGNPRLTSIVSVSDLLCRLGGLGYGYTEDKQTNFAEEPGFATLAAHYRSLHPFDLARFTFETEGLLEEVRAVVARVYGTAQWA
ncbi:MAG: hypothetical protein DMG94_11170 [Acidobacteria bacterium]|nr:MAG: hypothetical protein DMG94_11170 [Acidobacteriota bacterium]